MRAVVHIGGAKAASTTLQRALFSKHPGLHYVGEDGEGYNGYQPLIRQLQDMDDVFWDPEPARKFFSENLAASRDKTFVFSDEDIMPSPVASECAHRLRALIPGDDTHVLIIIRNQITALESYYCGHGAYLRPAPYPQYKRHVPLESWLKFNFDIMDWGAIPAFDFWPYADYFEKVFGEGKVRIMLFEELTQNPDKFFAELSDLLQIPASDIAIRMKKARERERPTRRRWRYNKFRSAFLWTATLSRFLPGFLVRRFRRHLSEGPKARAPLPPHWITRAHGRFAENNAKLATRYGLDLAQYGYPLPPSSKD